MTKVQSRTILCAMSTSRGTQLRSTLGEASCIVYEVSRAVVDIKYI